MKTTIKKITTGLLAAFTTVTTAALLNVASVSAWGPERATFTMENPASYPTFNSITNNPTIGDERDFVRVGEINADVTQLANEVEIVPGKQYLVYIYFHNNASATYNDSAHNNVGVAFGTTMSSAFSTVLTPAEKATISATITANNSNPTSVWDEAYMTTNYGKVFLRYVSGSAKIYNDWATNGSIMPSSLFTEAGTFIGLNELNGVIPGCEEYHGVVTYVLEAEELSGTVDKEVSKDGTNFYNTVEAAPGDELQFRLTIKNAGDVALTNATIADALPAGLELVPGSVQLSANDSGVWDPLSDNLIGTGYNLGTVGTGNIVYITYRAKVASNIDCGSLNLTNVATFTYDSETSTGDSDNSSTSINVKKDDCIAPVPETPSEIVNTGPLEIAMAAVVVIAIGGAGFYLWRTKHTLKAVENVVTGPNGQAPIAPTATSSDAPASPVAPDTTTSTTASTGQAPIDSTQSQTPVAPAGFSQSVAQPPVGPVQEPPVGTSDNSSKPEGN